jgi:heme/copper-type cytochrome/quinol oxidase subunit 1
MPRHSVWALRFALGEFLLGVTIGALLLIQKAWPFFPAIWALLPAHIELLLFGWLLHLVFGVAYWIFPRLRIAPKRGPEWLAWLALWSLNAGLLCVAVAPLWPSAPLPALGRGLEALAVLALVVAIWPRVKPTETGSQPAGA